MPLVTSRDYDLVPQFSNIGVGASQGMQLANQFQLGQQQREQAKRQSGQFELQQQREAAEFEQQQSVIRAGALNQLAKNMKTIPPERWDSFIDQNAEELAKFNIDASVLKGQAKSIQDLDDVIASTGALMARPTKSAAQIDFESKTAGMTPEEIERAKRIDLGLDPRAVGSAAITISETGKTQDVAKSEAQIEGSKAAAKEASKLGEQLKLKPEVEAAVATALAGVKQQTEMAAEARSNDKALAVYDTAISNLSNALGATTTGKFVGLLPAMTANAQVADGAVAMMAPVLKQLFRDAGEGTFTDADQRMLLALIPTRNTLPEARDAQLAAIDNLVRAKLGGGKQKAPVEKQGGQIMIDANGNRAMVYPDGSFEEM